MGGMQKHSAYLLRYLLKSAVDVTLIHPGPKSIADSLPEFKGELNEIIVKMPIQGPWPWSYLRTSYAYSIKVSEQLLKSSKDVQFVYAQGFSAWNLIELRRKGRFNKPIGVNFHGLEMFQVASGLKQRAIQSMFRGPVSFNLKNADVAYSLGTGLTKILHEKVKLDSYKISQIPIALEESWVRTDKQKDFSNSVRKFLFIGRYERRKGVEELTEVIGQKEWDNAEFHFIGPIPKSKQIKKPCVHYHGRLDSEQRIREIIDDCHVLLVPSYSEGMPTVIMEAMARGLLIVASEVGAVSDQVNESNGILIKPGDTVQLMSAIQAMMELPIDRVKAMSVHSIKTMESKFVWSKVIERTISDTEERVLR